MPYASMNAKRALGSVPKSSMSARSLSQRPKGIAGSLTAPDASRQVKSPSLGNKTPAVGSKTPTTGSDTGSKGSIVKMDDPIGSCTVTCGALNVRKGPGTNYSRIGGLTQGKTVQIYEAKDGWLRIGYGTEYGWIASKYTDYKEAEQPPENPLPDGAIYEVVITGSVNVRTGPGKSYKDIGTLHKGDTVIVYEEKDGWYRIEFEGQEGWFNASYAEIVSGPGPEQPGPGPDPDPDPDPPEPDPDPDTGDKAVAAGKKAEQAARDLMARSKSEGWKYSQPNRKKDGYYDCSSFCCRAWKEAGYDFNWANSGKMAEICDDGGARVDTGSNNNAIAGDLLFFSLKESSNYLSISHVAIATDNKNEMIDPGTKSVSISNPNGSYYGGKIVMVGRPGMLMK